MAQAIETEVLVVGAGPVGLLTGLHLANRGIAVRVVDEEFRTAAHSYALALHPKSLELFDDLGLAKDLITHGHRVETIAFYEGSNRRGEMNLSKLDAKFPFVLVLPQSGLEAMLEQQLKRKGVKVLWNHRVSSIRPGESCVTAVIDKMARASCGYAVATTEWVIEKTLDAKASFVVGADGHRSIVRRNLGTEYDACGEGELFAVFEFHSDADLGGEVRIVFDRQTTNVLWPLPGGRFRWSFQRARGAGTEGSRAKRRLTVPIGRQAFPHVPGDELSELIQERAPWFVGKVGRIDWSMEVRFDRRLVGSYGRDRMWLAGDAAHLTGPVGGQSLNMGLRESSDLAQRINGVLREGAQPSSLAEYSEQHLGHWRQLLAIDGGLATTDQAETWAKEHCPKILSCIPATGEHLDALATQIGLEVVRT